MYRFMLLCRSVDGAESKSASRSLRQMKAVNSYLCMAAGSKFVFPRTSERSDTSGSAKPAGQSATMEIAQESAESICSVRLVRGMSVFNCRALLSRDCSVSAWLCCSGAHQKIVISCGLQFATFFFPSFRTSAGPAGRPHLQGE